MVATTMNSLVNLVQVFNFYVRTWLHQDLAVESLLGLRGYSILGLPQDCQEEGRQGRAGGCCVVLPMQPEKVSVCLSLRQEKTSFL